MPSALEEQAAGLVATLFPCCFPRRRRPARGGAGDGPGSSSSANERTPLLGADAAGASSTSIGSAGAPGSKRMGSLAALPETSERRPSPFGPPPSGLLTRTQDKDRLQKIVGTLQGTFLPVAPPHSSRHLLSASTPGHGSASNRGGTGTAGGTVDTRHGVPASGASVASSSRSNYESVSPQENGGDGAASIKAAGGEGAEGDGMETLASSGAGMVKVSRRPVALVRSIRLSQADGQGLGLPLGASVAAPRTHSRTSSGSRGASAGHVRADGAPSMSRQNSTSSGIGGGLHSAETSPHASQVLNAQERPSSKLVHLWGQEEEDDVPSEVEAVPATADKRDKSRRLSVNTAVSPSSPSAPAETSTSSRDAATPKAASGANASASGTGSGFHASGPLTPTGTGGPISPSGSALALPSLSMTAAAVPPTPPSLNRADTDAKRSLRKNNSSSSASRNASTRMRTGSGASTTLSKFLPGSSSSGSSSGATELAPYDPSVAAAAAAAARTSAAPQEVVEEEEQSQQDWQDSLEARLLAVTMEAGPLMEGWEDAEPSPPSNPTSPDAVTGPSSTAPIE